MLRIKQIRIKNFRSIVDLDINVDKMNIFVGLNDAGKSNILKALNLFFNNETEPGCAFDFETDYSKYAPVRKKKAKEIEISIVFAIPVRYSYHEDVEWIKTWRDGGMHGDNSSEWNFTPYSKVPTLLKRIRYKYVPAVKSDNYFKLLLADLYMSIAKEVNSELIQKAEEYSLALDGFTQKIGLRVQKIVGIKSNLIMPTNQVDIFKELVFATNDKSGKSVELSYRGDGIKAVHIPAILKYTRNVYYIGNMEIARLQKGNITFYNLDGDEIEKELGIATCPVNWPIGSGKGFKGVYDRNTKEVMTFSDTLKGTKEGTERHIHIDDPALVDEIGEAAKEKLLEEIELLDGASAEFDMDLVSKGELSPVFFGSALTNFGVETFLQHFLKMTYSPLPRKADNGEIDPFQEDFSAFVFKIQANMNKAHRDRIAFMRICSGKFEAGMEVTHVQGGNKKIKLSQPQQMMAQERHIVDEAYAGDIIGVFDPGIFSIGDTLTTAKPL